MMFSSTSRQNLRLNLTFWESKEFRIWADTDFSKLGNLDRGCQQETPIQQSAKSLISPPTVPLLFSILANKGYAIAHSAAHKRKRRRKSFVLILDELRMY